MKLQDFYKRVERDNSSSVVISEKIAKKYSLTSENINEFFIEEDGSRFKVIYPDKIVKYIYSKKEEDIVKLISEYRTLEKGKQLLSSYIEDIKSKLKENNVTTSVSYYDNHYSIEISKSFKQFTIEGYEVLISKEEIDFDWETSVHELEENQFLGEISFSKDYHVSKMTEAKEEIIKKLEEFCSYKLVDLLEARPVYKAD